ncbi:MAG: RNA-splicing ligase RtcB, partial [Bacteroidota bacterium]
MKNENTTTMITGRTLIDLGFAPGKWFAGALAHLAEHPLEGKELLAYLHDVAPEPVEVIAPHAAPLPYHRNLRAEADTERDNVEKVFATMDALMTTPTLEAGAVMPDAC